MPSKLELRPLNPSTDIDLFRDAYQWRQKKPSKLRPDRMSFEDFSADKPNQIVMGLFNGRLLAVYFFLESPARVLDCHYTSARDAPKADVLAGARTLINTILDSGAVELLAYVSRMNRPLQRAVEAMGFQPDCLVKFPPQNIFIKYAVRRKT